MNPRYILQATVYVFCISGCKKQNNLHIFCPTDINKHKQQHKQSEMQRICWIQIIWFVWRVFYKIQYYIQWTSRLARHKDINWRTNYVSKFRFYKLFTSLSIRRCMIPSSSLSPFGEHLSSTLLLNVTTHPSDDLLHRFMISNYFRVTFLAIVLLHSLV